MKIKYIIFDDLFPVIFHAGIPHNKIHASMLHKGLKATSAGFVSVKAEMISPEPGVLSPYNVINVNCHGESESLKIKSHPKNDNLIIESFLNEEE